MPDSPSQNDARHLPVHFDATSTERTGPEKGIALCLSGGGYRAMLFHVGSLWRLNEAGVLGHIRRLSSVSGGSITAGVLGLAWNELQFEGGSAPQALFDAKIVTPLRRLAGRTIDVRSVATGALLPGVTISDRVAAAYDKYLFGGKTLQDLPDDVPDKAPRFVINATNVQTGSLWRFSKPYMGDYQVGRWRKPDLRIAVAVAASSAFPPVLSPCVLSMEKDPDPVVAGETTPKYRKLPYTAHVVLSDGGVYDNLGLETAFKRYTTLLVSDGGMKMSPDPDPHEDWGLHSKRVLDLVDNQVRSLRKRQLIDALKSKLRSGAYWGIATHLAKYQLPDDPFGYLAVDHSWKDTADLAATPTRLAAMESLRQESLINWGYVVCDAALRKHAVDPLKSDYAIVTKSAAVLPYNNPT
jgi:NTE family protein